MRIGEVAKISRCPAVTIRYYEKIGLLPNAKRTAANYRIYDQNDPPLPQPRHVACRH